MQNPIQPSARVLPPLALRRLQANPHPPLALEKPKRKPSKPKAASDAEARKSRPAKAPARKPAPKTPSSSGPKKSRWTLPALGLAVLLAFPLALLIQALRVPDRAVAATPPQNQRPLGPLFATALASPQASTLELWLPEINAHLAQVLQPAKAAAGNWNLQRAGVRLEPGKCEVLTLQKWQGWDVYLNATYAISLKGGKLRLTLLSGSLGRLQLSPFWMARLEQPLTHLVPFLRRERVLFDRLLDLKVDSERMVLSVRITG